MTATILQLLGLALFVTAGALTSPAAFIATAALVFVYVGLAVERE